MTNRELVLTYLRSVSPRAATNRDIAEATGIEPPGPVYDLTQESTEEGVIHGANHEREWFFWLDGSETLPEALSTPKPASRLTLRQFEDLARSALSEHYNTQLAPGWVGTVHKRFRFVSPGGGIVGEAKYYTRVGGTRWAPAKAAAIAKLVWLLEDTGAPQAFLVFGHDRQAPVMWLERYGNLASHVRFFFLTDDGELEELSNPSAVRGSS
ncbi:MAG TPA: hypothetical protein VMW58_06495 [Anaerolineae bacterium]|nr:hypothetical protein [Anaerolineae bacterium]